MDNTMHSLTGAARAGGAQGRAGLDSSGCPQAVLHQRRRAPLTPCQCTHKQTQVLRALAARSDELGSTLLVAHEQFCISDGARDARRTPKSLWPSLGRVNCHTYDSSEFVHAAPRLVCRAQDNRFKRAALRKSAGKAGRPVWVSEYGTGKGAEALARHVLVSGAEEVTLCACAACQLCFHVVIGLQ